MKGKNKLFVLLAALVLLSLAVSCSNGGGDDSVTITYLSNGAEYGTAPATQSGDKETVQILSDNTGSLAKDGYLFMGWNTAADGNGTDYAPGASYSGRDLTLYAKWAAIFKYSIISSATSSYAGDEALKALSLNPTYHISITGFTDSGIAFVNVDVPAKIDSMAVKSISGNAFENCTNLESMTLPETITSIGCDAFKGCTNLNVLSLKGSVPIMSVDFFDELPDTTIRVSESHLSEYESSGWNTLSGGKLSSSSTYTVRFDRNKPSGSLVFDGIDSKEMADQVFVIGKEQNLRKNSYSVGSDFKFVGWSTEKNPAEGSAIYEDGQSVKNLTDVGGGVVTLHAQWSSLMVN